MNSQTSAGGYKHVADVVSDLNIMIQEAPINNKYRCELADMVWKLKKEETLKSLSQFLHEVKSVKNAEGVLADFEYYFSDELCPPNSDA